MLEIFEMVMDGITLGGFSRLNEAIVYKQAILDVMEQLAIKATSR